MPETNRYRVAREAAVMTQEQLAAAAEVSVSTVRRIETGRSTGPESRRAVASVLGIDVREPVEAPAPSITANVRGIGSAGIVLVRRTALDRIALGYLLAIAAAVWSVAGLLSRTGSEWQGIAIWHGLVAGMTVLFVVLMGRAAVRVPFMPYTIGMACAAGGILSFMVSSVSRDPWLVGLAGFDAFVAWLLCRTVSCAAFHVHRGSKRLGGTASLRR